MLHLHSEPIAKISLSSMQTSAQSWPRTSFLLTDLIAQSWLSDFLSAKITSITKLIKSKVQHIAYLAITSSTEGGLESEVSKIYLD